MQVSRALTLISVSAILLSCLTQEALAQGTTTFTVNIPLKRLTANPFPSIAVIKATIALRDDVTAGNPIIFTFRDQPPLSHSISATCNPNCTFSSHFTPTTPPLNQQPADCKMSNIACFTDNENPSSGFDEIVINRTSGPSQDPVRYEIDFHLSSNHGSP